MCMYINTYQGYLHQHCSMTVHLDTESNKIYTRRGVRQGDAKLSKLFTATLESIFRRLT